MIIVIVYYLFYYAYFISLFYAKLEILKIILFHSFTGLVRVAAHISVRKQSP
jgi:hypothetical protein